MLTRVADALLPVDERRSVDDLTADLDLGTPGARAKRSAFWIMLTLSAIIASAGIVTDSTATVIGAMIIAPLSTPILGVALGIAKRDGALARRSLGFLAAGATVAILTGALFSVFIPGTANLLDDSQIAGRTSPGLADLAAALATGVAGAVAMARRDVAAVLPGVAIAISLVPPLAVTGVCLGQGALGLAFGALLLFLSNVLALVLIGALVFTALTRSRYVLGGDEGSQRKAYTALGLLMLLILVPLFVNTASTVLLNVWTTRVHETADAWARQVPGTVIEDVQVSLAEIRVQVLANPDPPPPADLAARLDGQVPAGVVIVVVSTVGTETRTTVGSS